MTKTLQKPKSRNFPSPPHTPFLTKTTIIPCFSLAHKQRQRQRQKKKHKKLPFFSPTDVLHTSKNTSSSISHCFYLGLCFLSNPLMAENQSSGRDPKTAAATTFSQLLFFADHDEDDDIDVDKHHHVHHQIFEYSVSSSFAIENPPKMLCFGTKQEQEHPQLGLRSAHACSDSVKRKNGSNPETTAIKPAPLSNQKASKKTKPEAPCSAGHAKVRQFLPCSCFFLCFYEMGFVFLVILEEGEARRKNHSATTIGFAVRQGCRKKKKNRVSNFITFLSIFKNLISIFEC